MIFFGGCAGEPEFGNVVSNIASIIDEAIDDIVAMGTLRKSVEAALEALLQWSKEPDSTVWFGVSCIEAHQARLMPSRPRNLSLRRSSCFGTKTGLYGSKDSQALPSSSSRPLRSTKRLLDKTFKAVFEGESKL